jgi:hypothetical protein
LRRTPPLGPVLRPDEAACLQRPGTSHDPQIQGCLQQQSNAGVCDDGNSINPAAAVIEVQEPLPTYVVADTSQLFAGVNADVRPAHATVEAIMGTELLQRLSTTIDYPNGRVIAHCVDQNCLTYPKLIQLNECGQTCLDTAAVGPIQCANVPDSVPPDGGCTDQPPPVLVPYASTRTGAVCPPMP